MENGVKYGSEFVYKKQEKKDSSRADNRLLFTAAVSLVICIAFFAFASFSAGGVKIICSAQEIYAVATGQFEDESAALRHSAVQQQRGGAGTVYFDKIFFVLAVCFSQEKDAQSVAGKLTSSNEYAEVIKIVSSKAVINFEGNAKQASTVKKALDFFLQAFDALSTVSLDFDREKLTQNAVFGEVAVLLQNAQNARSSLLDLKGLPSAGSAFAAFERLIGFLSDLQASRQDSAELKKCTFNIFLCYKSLKENLK